MKRPALVAWSISGLATIIWAAAILAAGLTDRVIEHWEAALTMLFGSFLAGSSPEGGGAVAFPVFTKGLGVSAPVARTFGLSIQAVGMTIALVAILVNRRPLHVRSAVAGSLSAVVGFLLAVLVLGRHGDVFWPSSIGTAWVKATFSIVLATTSFLMVRLIRAGASERDLSWTSRHDWGVVIAAFAGGILSSLTGTGANILIFLFLVILADVDPRLALPTAMTVMAVVSVVGFVLYAVVDGQMDLAVEAGRVTSVGGADTDLAASQSDLLGMWLAALPVVVWGAPLGSLVASLVKERQLAAFVAVLAAVEVVSTVVLVPELRTEAALMTYLGLGLTLMPISMVLMQKNRGRIFAVPELVSDRDGR